MPKACPYVMASSFFVTVGGKKIPCVVGTTQGEIFDEMVRWIISPHLTSKFFFSYLPR